jgi:hypothetical protein
MENKWHSSCKLSKQHVVYFAYFSYLIDLTEARQQCLINIQDYTPIVFCHFFYQKKAAFFQREQEKDWKIHQEISVPLVD